MLHIAMEIHLDRPPLILRAFGALLNLVPKVDVGAVATLATRILPPSGGPRLGTTGRRLCAGLGRGPLFEAAMFPPCPPPSHFVHSGHVEVGANATVR